MGSGARLPWEVLRATSNFFLLSGLESHRTLANKKAREPVQLKTRSAGDFKTLRHQTRISRRYSLREMLAQGQTENISPTGVLFVTDSVVPVGAGITLKVHLRSITDADNVIVLEAVGKVLRAFRSAERSRLPRRFDSATS